MSFTEPLKKICMAVGASVLLSTFTPSCTAVQQNTIEDVVSEVSLTYKHRKAARKYLTNDFINKHAEELEQIARAAGEGTGRAYRFLPKDLMADHADDLVKIAQAAGEETCWAYEYLPVDLMEDHSGALVKIAQVAEGNVAGLFVFHKRVLGLDLNLLQKNKKEFGIEFFHRYINQDLRCFNSDLSSSLLEENIKNLNPDYNSSKPIALVIFNKNDPDDAFEKSGIRNNLENLTKNYKVLIFETDNEKGVYKAIEKAGQLYGLNEKGNPHKPISLLILAGHGNQISINFGRTEIDDTAETIEELLPYEKAYIDLSDEDELRKLGKYIGENAQVVYISCSTGEGKEKEDNVANMTKKAWPNVSKIFAPTTSSSSEKFILDEKGHLINVEYDTSSDKTYTIK